MDIFGICKDNNGCGMQRIDDKIFNRLLKGVAGPARYCGGEYNTPAIKGNAALNFCMCFPDTYEVGFSNLGIKILFGILNEKDNCACDMAFAPHKDFADNLRAENISLFGLQTRRPLGVFDMVGFSMQYELSLTNVLYMLDLGGIPLYARDRSDSHPLVVLGGPVCVNPAPLAAFADIICVGDGEDTLTALADLFVSCKYNGANRREFLTQAAGIEGVYIPAIGNKVVRAAVKELDKAYFPTSMQVPHVEAVHNRAVLELFRGCGRGCRFCQAGFIYRPVRRRTPETLVKQAKRLIDNCGYDEIGLASLSTCDYPHLKELLALLKPLADKRKVKLSLPSTRVDAFAAEFAADGRKGSITFAPEAGTQRLRDVIRKNVTDTDIESSLTAAFRAGFTGAKLYFMIGLPTETQEDIEGIVKIVHSARALYRAHKTSQKGLALSVSASLFVPKSFTPFQWEAQDTRDSAGQKQRYLKDALKKLGVRFSYHDTAQSALEAAFARGDGKLSAVAVAAYKSGCCFDGWSEHFDMHKWLAAFEACGIDINEYLGAIDTTAPLPWDIVDIGVSKDFLLAERKKAYEI